MNVLLTGAGSSPSIVRAFVDAARVRGGRVLVASPAEFVPALAVAPTVRVPAPPDPGFLEGIDGVVQREGIEVIVPLGDDELPILAIAAGSFRALGCFVASSTLEFVILAEDKLATVEQCRAWSVRTPDTWAAAEAAMFDLPERLFVRPRRGSGSRGARGVSRGALAETLADGGTECVVQAEVRSAEVTIDALFGFDGTPIHYVPRLRVAVEAGRSVRAVTVSRPALSGWIEPLLARLGASGARGLVSVQAFVGWGEPMLVEVNARAASGLPLTIAAGGDHVEWLLELVDGRRPDATMGAYTVGLESVTAPEFLIGPSPQHG